MKLEDRLLSDEELEYISDNIIEGEIEIYTDGSCIINNSKNKSTYAIVVVEKDNIIFECTGSFDIGTNNRSELMALIQAVQVMIFVYDDIYDIKVKTTIYSDSKYAINTLFVWSKKWLEKNIKKKNLDLVRLFHSLDEPLKFRKNVKWVKGHSDNKWNDYVDNLCLLEY